MFYSKVHPASRSPINKVATAATYFNTSMYPPPPPAPMARPVAIIRSADINAGKEFLFY